MHSVSYACLEQVGHEGRHSYGFEWDAYESREAQKALWSYRVLGVAYATKGLLRGEWMLSDSAALAAADYVWPQLTEEARAKLGPRP